MTTARLILGAAMAVLCPAGSAQIFRATAAIDTFIGAIETMKRSVVPLVCVAMNGTKPKILQRTGTAFFISGAGDFLTAAHVILTMERGEHPCPIPAFIVPVENWNSEVREEDQVWFSFRISDCKIDADLDVARCRADDDLSVQTHGSSFKIIPVQPELSIPPDGTQVAFTGFPLGVRDPLTSRAGLAAHRTIWQNEKAHPELLLDRAAWPGSSGSPVYLSDGRVIGILVAGGKDDGTGMTILRPVLPDMLTKGPTK